MYPRERLMRQAQASQRDEQMSAVIITSCRHLFRRPRSTRKHFQARRFSKLNVQEAAGSLACGLRPRTPPSTLCPMRSFLGFLFFVGALLSRIHAVAAEELSHAKPGQGHPRGQRPPTCRFIERWDPISGSRYTFPPSWPALVPLGVREFPCRDRRVPSRLGRECLDSWRLGEIPNRDLTAWIRLRRAGACRARIFRLPPSGFSARSGQP